jgi:DNA-binding CsgD family transcriptional regulator
VATWDARDHGGVGDAQALELTPSERRVAQMAAAGLSNREIAQQLFVTARTVEGHLTHAYQKLRITSRAQLAEALAAPDAADSPQPASVTSVASSRFTRPRDRYNVVMAAGIVAAIVTTIIVVAVLAVFVWAAREDGRAQRRQDRLTGRRRR